jgi:hypothetical protein
MPRRWGTVRKRSTPSRTHQSGTKKFEPLVVSPAIPGFLAVRPVGQRLEEQAAILEMVSDRLLKRMNVCQHSGEPSFGAGSDTACGQYRDAEAPVPGIYLALILYPSVRLRNFTDR